MRAIKFSYVRYKDKVAPVIWFRVKFKQKWHTVWAYVDSGATFTILTAKEADRIGLDYQKGKQVMVTVGDGGAIPVYIHKLQAMIGDKIFKATIGFSPRLGIGFNLLGRHDIFNRFDVTFSDSNQSVIFRPIR
ncbi:MAG: retropepsin-like domain-containing protein [Elusimicrobia bacterium]|nr:retropepsin-like domain-containing protein [Elusimicrobiota bacterium]